MKRPDNYRVEEGDYKEGEWHVYDCATDKLMAICQDQTTARMIAFALEFEHNPRAYGYEMSEDF